ncbi:Gamma-aminobutyraldehyde dehydrogenase [Streptomyces violarus]
MIKKTVLELGGSDPFVVMPSADIDRAAQVAVTARVQNTGQSCIAAKRFIVHTDVYDAFAERFAEGMKALKVGDPMAEDTEVGPLSSEQGLRDLEELVDDAVRGGADVLCGGERPDGPGWYYAPTILAGITREMRIHREEAFGAGRHAVPGGRPGRGRADRERLAVRTEFERGHGTRPRWTGSSGTWRRAVCTSTG